jgi:HSP20 family molecular chaperone IbpA
MIKQNKSFLEKVVKLDKNGDEAYGRQEPKEVRRAYADEQPAQRPYPAQQEPEQNWNEEQEEVEDGQLALDVYQDKDYVVIKSIVGGVRPEDLDLTVTADMVTIKGSRRRTEEVNEDNYYYKECFWGSFSRSVILPCDIKTDKVEASMKNGVLTIRMPKVEKNLTTKVAVRGE